MLRTRVAPIVAAFLIAIFVITAALSVRGKSSTWDDPYHLTGGISQLQTGDPRLNADHPPLARLIGAIPSLFIPVESIAEIAPDAWKRADLFQATTSLFDTIEDRLLWPSRLTMLIFSVLLGGLLYAWGRDLFGFTRALLPLVLYAFCPPLLANAPLVTTDMAATTFIFASVYGWWCYLKEPSLNRLLWTSLAVAAAFSTKHNAVLLIPLFLVLGVLAAIFTAEVPIISRGRWQSIGGGLLLIGFITLLGINLVYFFEGSFLTPSEYIVRAQTLIPVFKTGAGQLILYWPTWLPVPLPFHYMAGFLNLLVNVEQGGHATYFMGEAGYGGWPHYFLVILLIKLSIPCLILIILGTIRAFERLPQGVIDLLFLILPPVLLVGVASFGKMQIGIRHILPALPFLLLLTGYTLHDHLNYWGKSLIGVLVVFNTVGSLMAHPYYLMYFNFFAGGPDRGWRISVTGDDYGQGDADLQQWLQTRGVKEIAYGPFGWGQAILHRAGIKTKSIPCQDTGELVAIHTGQLLLTYTLEQTLCYTWMRLREPDEKIGYSIFLYNTKNININSDTIPRPLPPANLELFNQALALQLKGEKEQAIVLYRQYLIQEPDYYQAHFNLACALMDTGQCSMAIPEFKRTLEIWPSYKEAHLHLSKCYQQLRQQDKMQWHEEEYRKK